ncbi:MAG: HlyD family efflux transporter periplasmic adaptor subunit [Ruminococcus sp.]|nr:HlyD family efflux transporter periplasmic adaptor subunit [Ruminococcus sp.]
MAEIKEIKDVKDIKGDKEEYNPRRKREIIKTILIIFLAVLLILLFFSNTIMNRSLPQITTERTTSGKLTERLRGSGMVMSNQSYSVTVDGNKIIDTINVKVGKEVEKGDVLMTVGTGESEELNAAIEALETLELEYNKALLSPGADYSSENQAIKHAREDLAEAISKRDDAIDNQDNAEAEKSAYKENKSQLNSCTKLRTKLSAIISAIDMDDYSTAPAEYTGELINLKSELDDAEKTYQEKLSIYTAMLSGENNTEEETTVPTVVSQETLSAAKTAMEEAETARNAAADAYDTKKDELRNEYSAQLTDTESNIEYYTALIEEYESGMIGEGMSLEMLNEDVKAKQRALEDLIAQLDKAQKDNAAQDKLESLNLTSMKNNIEKAKAKVEKLKKENETTEITAKHSGIVSSVNAKAGDETYPDMEIITIDISSEGYTVEITVDGEKTRKIKKGVEAEVLNNWSGNVQAVLTNIKNDTTPNSKSRILVFSVTGDVESNTNLDLSIPLGSGNYDTIIPKSAVYTDNKGSFVLTVQSKNSPLGNRYYAQRVPVEVICSDEVSSAVNGSINYGDYVIIASSLPVKPGDQVRMKDE